jgi:hypothetical protein
MPFEPRLFRDDDELNRLPGQGGAAFGVPPREAECDEVALDLPPELAALGEQLGDDSDHLAARYPAGRTSQPVEATPTPTRRRIMLRWGGAAAALFVAIGTWQVTESRLVDGDRHASRVVPALPIAVTNPALIVPKPAVSENGLPASVFRGLTGAEQEAVLDLMQDDPQQRGELSI